MKSTLLGYFMEAPSAIRARRRMQSDGSRRCGAGGLAIAVAGRRATGFPLVPGMATGIFVEEPS